MHLVVLRDSPSPWEIKAGLERSPAFNLFKQELMRVGLDNTRIDVRYLSFIPITDDDYKKGKLKRPPDGMAKYNGKGMWIRSDCLTKYEKEIAKIKQEENCIYLVTGAYWHSILNKENSNFVWRGTFFEFLPSKFNLVTHDIETVFLQQTNLPAMRADLAKLAKVLHGAPIPEPPKTSVEVITKFPRAKEFFSDTQGDEISACDIETFRKHLSCIGFSSQETSATVVPFLKLNAEKNGAVNIFSTEDEFELRKLLRLKLRRTHKLVGQNFTFDLQFLFRELFFFPDFGQVEDTMVLQHTLSSMERKSLDYLASVYLPNYRFWKEDKGKGEDSKLYFAGTPELWQYNGEDCSRTYALRGELWKHLERENLTEQASFQLASIVPILSAMLRGTRCDLQMRERIKQNLRMNILAAEDFLRKATQRDLNPRSPKQLLDFFYGELKLPKQFSKQKKVTADEEALIALGKIEPLVKPLGERINAIRSQNNLLKTADMELGLGERIYSSYNVAGTETYRLSSSDNAYGEGRNQQNITKGNETDSEKKPLPTNHKEWVPNLRKMYLPDDGFVLADGDLAGADAMVVIWEADDILLKQALATGMDIHLFNANDIFNLKIPVDELNKKHPNYEEHKTKHDKPRQKTKVGVHGTNYGATPKTIANSLGILVKEAESFQKRWFDLHPGIRDWHNRVRFDLETKRTVSNAFGYRLKWIDRLDYRAINAALAWGPQSTVAIVTQRIMLSIAKRIPPTEAQLLNQVHDSLVYQLRHSAITDILQIVKECAKEVVVPYADPLVIPFELAVKKSSWGS